MTWAYIEPRETKLYAIPRSKLWGLPKSDALSLSTNDYYRIDVAGGIAGVVQR